MFYNTYKGNWINVVFYSTYEANWSVVVFYSTYKAKRTEGVVIVHTKKTGLK